MVVPARELGHGRSIAVIQTARLCRYRVYPRRLRHNECAMGVGDLSDATTNWKTQISRARSALYKRIIYAMTRRGLSVLAKAKLESIKTLSYPSLSLVLPERGFPLETRRSWANRRAHIRGKTVLIVGAGTGWEAPTWLSAGPFRIIALDLCPFVAAWKEIRSHYPSIHFLVARNEQLPVDDRSIDLIASDAVLEHCTDMPAVAREMMRALRPGGYVYATYGPMWFCFGGDHFSSRGGDTHGYSHVELNLWAYRQYFEAHRLPDEDAQSGGRYVELDLFSKWTTSQYLECFRDIGFEIADLILEISSRAVAFRHAWPQRFDAIAKRNNVDRDDLIIKGNLILLRKP